MPVAEARIAEELISPSHGSPALSQASSAHWLRTQRATWGRDPRSEPKNGSEHALVPLWLEKEGWQRPDRHNREPSSRHNPPSRGKPAHTHRHKKSFQDFKMFCENSRFFHQDLQRGKKTSQASLGDSLSSQQIFIDLSSNPYLMLSIRIRLDWK